MNGGALPPEITEEMAALIDAGQEVPGATDTIAADPRIIAAMGLIQGRIDALPADYQAAKAHVAGDYQNLTGDVLQSGTNFMQDLYGRVMDPNDPNAAAMMNDPVWAQYAQGMTQLDETSDLNQATDMAWFEKMQQNADQSYRDLLMGIQSGLIPLAQPEVEGGGGGGGRGRGGGGGSGGGNVNDWKVPTNTQTNLTSATDTATGTATEYSPDFYNALMEASAHDPELQALTQRIWEQSPQNALGMTNEVAKRLTEAEMQQQQMQLQGGLAADWKAAAPLQIPKVMNQMVTGNYKGIWGDDPATAGTTERWYVPPPPEGQTPQPTNFTEEQGQQNQLAQDILQAVDFVAPQHGTSWFRADPGSVTVADPDDPRYPLTDVPLTGGKRKTRLLSAGPSANLESALEPSRVKTLARSGSAALNQALKDTPAERDFDYKRWSEGGGYVDEPDPADIAETGRNIGYYNDILDYILPWNPNATMVQTKNQVVNQGKDSSSYQTKNTNKSWGNALPGSPYDLSPELPLPAVGSNPVSNPSGYDIQIDAEGDEEVVPLGFGGGGTEAPTRFGGAKQIAALAKQRQRMATQAAEMQAAAKQPIKPVGKQKAASRKTAPEPVVTPTATVNRFADKPLTKEEQIRKTLLGVKAAAAKKVASTRPRLKTRAS
jgi:hypothetical protein